VRYRFQLGSVAWLLHRVTGVGLLVYLFMHIYVVSSLAEGKEAFDATMAFVQQPLFIIGELGLFFAVIFHALNGIRVILVDFGKGSLYHRKLFWALAGVGALIFIIGSIPVLPLLLEPFPGPGH
jgi:succinate dehydrogenase / fumarate reductase cytochrome b subunit